MFRHNLPPPSLSSLLPHFLRLLCYFTSLFQQIVVVGLGLVGYPQKKKRFADAINGQMFETSAKHGTNVDLAVLSLMREVLHHREFGAGGSSSTRYYITLYCIVLCYTII